MYGRKRFYANEHASGYYTSHRAANRANEQARQKIEEEERKDRRKRVARKRREMAEQKANSPEAVAAREAAAEAKAKHQAEVDAVAQERGALNLTPEEYQARFITPLIDTMAERLSGGDDVKKAAFIHAAHYALGTQDGDSEKVISAMHRNLRQGDVKFIGELGSYIHTYARTFEARHRLQESVLPAVNEVLEKVASEGLFRNVEETKGFLGFKGWLQTPYVSRDYEEQNRLDRRFGKSDPVWADQVAHIAKMGKDIARDPEAFKADLYEGLKECAAHAKAARLIWEIRGEEVKAAIDRGWFRPKQDTGSLDSAVGRDPEIFSAQDAAKKLWDSRVGFDGKVTFDSAAQETLRTVMENPATFREKVQKRLIEENAKVVSVVDLAEAYTKAAAVVSEGEQAHADIEQSIAAIDKKGWGKRLLSVFESISLRSDNRAAEQALEQSRHTMSEIQKSFDVAKAAARGYFNTYDGPKEVQAYADTIVRAAEYHV